ncbi:unnamed protein product [Urochloa humidicola]
MVPLEREDNLPHCVRAALGFTIHYRWRVLTFDGSRRWDWVATELIIRVCVVMSTKSCVGKEDPSSDPFMSCSPSSW